MSSSKRRNWSKKAESCEENSPSMLACGTRGGMRCGQACGGAGVYIQSRGWTMPCTPPESAFMSPRAPGSLLQARPWGSARQQHINQPSRFPVAHTNGMSGRKLRVASGLRRTWHGARDPSQTRGARCSDFHLSRALISASAHSL